MHVEAETSVARARDEVFNYIARAEQTRGQPRCPQGDGGLPELGAVMPHLICQACGLASYSAAVYGPADACPRCDHPLPGGDRRQPGRCRQSLGDLMAAMQPELAHNIERSTL